MEMTVCLGVLHEPSRFGNVMTEEHYKAMEDRIAKHGAIYGEYEMPNIQGISSASMLRRVSTVDATKISHKFTKVFMDGNRIMAVVTPAGPCKNMMESIMQVPIGNTSFSINSDKQPKFGIRGLKRPRENGDDLIEVFSFDLIVP